MRRRERENAEVREVEEGEDVAVVDRQPGRKGKCTIVRIYLEYTHREKERKSKVISKTE